MGTYAKVIAEFLLPRYPKLMWPIQDDATRTVRGPNIHRHACTRLLILLDP